MPRSDARFLVKNEANTAEIDLDDEQGPIIVPIHHAERSFRWLNEFRNEPRFELTPVGDRPDGDEPDRAA